MQTKDIRGITERIADVVANRDFGRASATKRGSNAEFPYVAIVKYDYNPVTGTWRTRNPKTGVAFATRDEALAYAQKCIDAQRDGLARDLATPRYRALREQHGLPRELPTD